MAVQKTINANLGLKTSWPMFLFLLLKSVSTTNFKLQFESSQVKILNKMNLQLYTSLSFKTKFKIAAIPVLA